MAYSSVLPSQKISWSLRAFTEIGNIEHFITGAGGSDLTIAHYIKNPKKSSRSLQATVSYPSWWLHLLVQSFEQSEDFNRIGRIIAKAKKIDAVMTVATKWSSFGRAVANVFECSILSKITEGSTVSVNHVSGSREIVHWENVPFKTWA